MSKQIEALKLALEALGWYDRETHQKAITAIREALAEQPAQQEPVTTSTLTDKQKESLNIARNLLAEWPDPDRKLLELYSAIEGLLNHKPVQQSAPVRYQRIERG